MSSQQPMSQFWHPRAYHDTAYSVEVIPLHPDPAYRQRIELELEDVHFQGLAGEVNPQEGRSSGIYRGAANSSPGPQSSSDSSQIFKPFACAICGLRYTVRKTLYRHMRTTHSSEHDSKFRCAQCNKACARKDILDRHIRSQHSAGGYAETVQCKLCHTWVRPRSLPAHQNSKSCIELQEKVAVDLVSGGEDPAAVPAESVASVPSYLRPIIDGARPRSLRAHQASVTCSQAHSAEAASEAVDAQHTWSDYDQIFSEQVTSPSTPSYLPAIADPVLLSAWLFVKFKPWGSGHRWISPFLDPSKANIAQPSIEVLELRGQVYRTIVRALSASNIDRDPALADAIAALTMITCQIDGWDAARVHVQGFVRLAHMQIKAAGGNTAGFAEVNAVDAFRTVLYKDTDVARSAAPSCEGVLVPALRLLRAAAIDIISAPLQYEKEPVWLRVHYLDGHDWFKRYEQQLLPIAALAESITLA